MYAQVDQYYKTVLNKWKRKGVSTTPGVPKPKHQFNQNGYRPYFFDESYTTRGNVATVTPDGKLKVVTTLSGLPPDGPVIIHPFGSGEPSEFAIDGLGKFVSDDVDGEGTVELSKLNSSVRITKFIKQHTEVELDELILPVTVTFYLSNGRAETEDELAESQ